MMIRIRSDPDLFPGSGIIVPDPHPAKNLKLAWGPTKKNKDGIIFEYKQIIF